jgi:hypothetical protein
VHGPRAAAAAGLATAARRQGGKGRVAAAQRNHGALFRHSPPAVPVLRLVPCCGQIHTRNRPAA